MHDIGTDSDKYVSDKLFPHISRSKNETWLR